MMDICAPDARQSDDDFERYVTAPPTVFTEWKIHSLFNWWSTCDFPSLRQWSYDTLSIPATTAEIERTFSQAKRTLTDDRNRLSVKAFEATQCLKSWRTQGLFDNSYREPSERID